MKLKQQSISIDVLNKILANNAILLFQTLNYHWNLTGPEFHDYHLLLDKQYKQLIEDMDLIAERVRIVGGHSLGSMSALLKNATMIEDTGKIPTPHQMITKLFQQNEYFVEQLRENITLLEKDTDDYGSKKMLEDLIERYEKVIWMLKSLLKTEQ